MSLKQGEEICTLFFMETQLKIDGQQLDWFQLETKTRVLVRDIINPVLQQSEEEKERYYTLNKAYQDLIQRIELLETQCFANKKDATKKTPTMFDLIFQKIEQLVSVIHNNNSIQDINEKSQNMELHQQVQNNEKSLEQVKLMLEINKQQFDHYAQYYQEIDQRYQCILQDLQNFKQLSSDQLKQAKQEMMNDYQDLSIQLKQIVKDFLINNTKLETMNQEIIVIQERLCLNSETLTQHDEYLKSLDQQKLPITSYEMFLEGIEKKLLQVDELIQDHSNKLVTLENYAEKYIPIKIQNIILDNLKMVVNKDSFSKLKGHENKLYNELTDSLLLDTGNGTIFQNIKKINEEISQRLNVSVDLTQLQQRREQAPSQMSKASKVYSCKQSPDRKSIVTLNAFNNISISKEEDEEISEPSQILQQIDEKQKQRQNNEGDLENDDKKSQDIQLKLQFTQFQQQLCQIEYQFDSKLKEFITKQESMQKEQFAYISMIHQEFDETEKRRLKDIKDEEQNQTLIMEDLVKIYEKIKYFDDLFTKVNKKLSYLYDKFTKMFSQKNDANVSDINHEQIKSPNKQLYTTFQYSALFGDRKGTQQQSKRLTTISLRRPSLSRPYTDHQDVNKSMMITDTYSINQSVFCKRMTPTQRTQIKQEQLEKHRFSQDTERIQMKLESQEYKLIPSEIKPLLKNQDLPFIYQ